MAARTATLFQLTTIPVANRSSNLWYPPGSACLSVRQSSCYYTRLMTNRNNFKTDLVGRAVYRRLIAGIANSNPAEGMDVRL